MDLSTVWWFVGLLILAGVAGWSLFGTEGAAVFVGVGMVAQGALADLIGSR